MIMSETHLRNPAAGRLSTLGDALSNALCACIISYCVVSFFAGQAGILAYRDIKSGIARMDNRIGILIEENKNLQDMREALTSNSDRMAREAREIGYLRPGEKIVILQQGAQATGSSFATHEIEPLRAGSSTGLPDSMIKLLAAMTGAAVLLASLLMAIMPKRGQAIRTTADRS